MKVVIALFGESGSGKDYLSQKLHEKYGYHKIIRTTSRKIRERESEGNPYFFKNDVELYKDITENTMNYLEVGVFNGFIYATHKDSLKSQINVGCFDVDAVEQLLDNSEIYTIPIYVYTPDKIRIMRQLEREEEPDVSEICRRYFDDEKKYKNFNFDYYQLDNTRDINEVLSDVKNFIDNDLE